MSRNLVRTPLSIWLTLLIGWGPCALGNVIGALTVVLDRPREMLFHLIVFLLYTVAAVPVTFLLRILWQHQTRWRLSSVLLLVTTFVLALGMTALGFEIGIRHGDIKGVFQWGNVLVGMQTIWFLLLAYCAMYFGIGYYTASQEETKRALAATTLAREAELRALRYQLHPHFLFNTLNAISTLVVEERTHDATRMIARLGDFLRATLEGGNTHEVSLAQELSLTEHYLDIEKVRFGERLTIAMHIGPETLQAAVPYLLLQPLVENAVRHGIAPRRHGGRLDFDAAQVAGRLHLTVLNDGVAGTPARMPALETDSSSVGLRNVRERLERLYENDHRFSVTLAEDGSCQVFIDLPYRSVSVIAPDVREQIA